VNRNFQYILGDLKKLRPVINYMPNEELMEMLEKEREDGRDDYSVRSI